MVTKEVIVKNSTGLHARPATAIVKKLATVNADVSLECNGKKANAKSLIGVLSLGITKGDTVSVIVSGENEETVCSEICEFIASLRD